MKKIFFFTLFSITCILSNAQDSYVIIKDSETNEALEFGHIVFKNLLDSNQFLGFGITDKEGKVVNEWNQDVYCTTSFIGYKTKTFPLKKGESKNILLEPFAFDLGAVSVTGQFTKIIKKDAIYEIKTISKVEIEQKGAGSVAESIQQELSISTNNGHSNESAIMLNGLSGAYVKVLIDGVPVEGKLKGAIDLSQINTSNIEKIEILEGPATVEYGTDAIAGAINIITKKNQNKKVSLKINTLYESVGKYNLSANIGLKLKKNFFNINFGRHFFNGYSLKDTSRYKEWKPREQYFAGISYSRKIKHLKIFYNFNYFNELMTSRGELRAPYYNSAFDTYYNTNRITNKFILSGRFNKIHHINISLSQSFYTRKRNIYYKDLTTLEQTISPSKNDQDTTVYQNYLARAVYNFKKEKSKINFLLGTSYKHNIIQANRVKNQEQYLGNFSIFGNLQYKPFKKLTIQPALRYGYNTKYVHPLLPSLSLKYDVSENLTFRTSYARGFRAPSLKELYIEFHFNSTINLYGYEGLKSENSHHFLLSADYRIKNKEHKIRFQPKFFYNKLNQMISLVSISDVNWQYRNIGEYDVLGAELRTHYQYKSLSLGLSYQLLGQKNSLFEKVNFEDKFHLSNQIGINVGIKVKKPKMSIAINYKYVGEKTGVYLDDFNEIQNSRLSDYQIVDISANKKFWKDRFSLTLGVKNLLNYNKIDLDGELFGLSAGKDADKLNVLWGRSFFASLKFEL